MAAKQPRALERNPNRLNLVEVNQYKRRINANITRVWENVLDWEHLPWLHDTSFDYVSIDEGGDWGWRTWSNPEKTSSVELTVNKENSEYVARSYDGDQQVSEIWTMLSAQGDCTDITVTFALPDIADEQVPKLGKLFLSLYTKLWDEDEQMMREREAKVLQQQLRYQGQHQDQQHQEQKGASLTLQKPITLPTTITLGQNDWTLREIQGKTIIHSATCPHLLGPLDQNAKIDHNIVTCPWHGYNFDVTSGECVKPLDAKCKLKTPPILRETGSEIIVTAS